MARSFANSTIISAFVSDSLSAFLSRRGYAAASSQGAAVSSVAKGGAAARMMKKSGEESAKTSWVPDPVTGYYRPEGKANEIDPAELRKMLLKHKSTNN